MSDMCEYGCLLNSDASSTELVFNWRRRICSICPNQGDENGSCLLRQHLAKVQMPYVEVFSEVSQMGYCNLCGEMKTPYKYHIRNMQICDGCASRIDAQIKKED